MIVGILGPAGCGGTFLDWSIQFLSGSKKHVVVQVNNTQGVIDGKLILDVVKNPLVGATAHAHKKNHPATALLHTLIDILSTSEYPVNTFYYGDDMVSGRTHTEYNNIIKTYPNIKFISYRFLQKHIDLIFSLQYEKVANASQRYNNQVGKSVLNSSTGELREVLSLFYPKCVKEQIINEQLDNANNVFMIEYDNVWSKLDSIMLEIFDFLGISIDGTRYQQWVEVYHSWLEKNKTNFFNDLPKILDCIVSGKSMSLDDYNITFAKEVVITSNLLYNYNLALQFNEASDLTRNTLQWHAILEKNTYHNLEIGRV